MLLSYERDHHHYTSGKSEFSNSNEWTRETAGRVTWSTLHLHAANMPFTEDHLRSEMAAKRRANELLNTYEHLFSIMGDLYVCSDCSNHFRSMISAHSLKTFVNDEINTRRLVGGATVHNPLERLRQLVSLYLCDLHNKVNERLKKPYFNCIVEELDRRWLLDDRRKWIEMTGNPEWVQQQQQQQRDQNQNQRDRLKLPIEEKHSPVSRPDVKRHSGG